MIKLVMTGNVETASRKWDKNGKVRTTQINFQRTCNLQRDPVRHNNSEIIGILDSFSLEALLKQIFGSVKKFVSLNRTVPPYGSHRNFLYKTQVMKYVYMLSRYF